MGQGLLKMNKISKLEINLINLFQGNLPLYQSYWFYYVLGNFAISAPLLIITKIQIQNFIRLVKTHDIHFFDSICKILKIKRYTFLF